MRVHERETCIYSKQTVCSMISLLLLLLLLLLLVFFFSLFFFLFVFVSFCFLSAFRLAFRCGSPNKGGLEILCDCADGIDRDGDLDLADGELDAYRDKKSAKELNQLEVAIGDGMEFTIHGKRMGNEEALSVTYAYTTWRQCVIITVVLPCDQHRFTDRAISWDVEMVKQTHNLWIKLIDSLLIM